ncbi:hypothetical protein [Streptomyces sp. NEAU-S77]|uniref:hypothetical protein n=1 Tax=Streptomyces sp. NEAU-S77 TaxID=3411033 RepID=UPI003BA2E1D7
MVWVDAALGADAMRVATAPSGLVKVVHAGFATAVTPRRVLGVLRGSTGCSSCWRLAPRPVRSPPASPHRR